MDKPASPEERLAKVVAARSGISRRTAEEWIAQGLVTVNGVVVRDLAQRVVPHTEHIKVKGKLLTGRPAPIYIKLHKPEGCLCTTADPEGRTTVLELLPRKFSKLFPVGRLDFNTSGLIFLTNDGEWAQGLTHPSKGVRKTYQARVSGIPTADTLARLRRGIKLGGRVVDVHRIEIIKRSNDRCWVELEIHEGRRHVVRDLLARVGHSVIRLRRTAIASITLHDLPLGHHKPLSARELRLLSVATSPRS